MSLLRSDVRLPTIVACALGAAVLGVSTGLLGVCGPFTDVAADSFCPFVQEVFYLGITTGTSPTTYDPASNVSRLQMAAFLSRTVDGVLKRGSRRAALNRFWTTEGNGNLTLTTVGTQPQLLVSDGEDLWVANGNNTVSRVHGSDGSLLQTWTGATSAFGVLSAMGRVFVTGIFSSPPSLYQIDPSQAAGAVTTVATNLGVNPIGIAFDGSRIWTANNGSVSIVTPGATIPWTVTTVAIAPGELDGALFDGANVWVTKDSPGTLLKLDSNAAVLQTVTVGSQPRFFVFDGANIWVPNSSSSSVSVVRASSGAVLGTLTGNGLNSPIAAAFDGQRILITNFASGADRVSLWKAADLTALGFFATGTSTRPLGACSDGVNFWITLNTSGRLARF